MIQGRRSSLLPAASCLLCVPLAACAGDGVAEAGDPQTYQVERATNEDGSNAVRILAGQMWAAPTRLVEDLSIGEELGDDAYMFGGISGAWAHGNSLYILDSQVPAIRRYDAAGVHLGDIGSQGQGPGQFQAPWGMAIDNEGRILVADPFQARIVRYDGSGAPLEPWTMKTTKSGLGLTVGLDGRIFTETYGTESPRMGVQEVTAEGLIGEILYPPHLDSWPTTVPVDDSVAVVVPFSPQSVWTYTASGHIVAGLGGPYSFYIVAADGSWTRVERVVEPVAVAAGEADFRAAAATAAVRQIRESASVSAADVLTHKPAYRSFQGDQAGRLWVRRDGPGVPDPACYELEAATQVNLVINKTGSAQLSAGAKQGADAAMRESLADDCWASAIEFDLFDPVTGDFLARIEAPEPGLQRIFFADADQVLASVTDTAGVLRLKRYRFQK